MLKLELAPGESVRIGNDVVVTLEKKTGQVARLAFDADKSIPIKRIVSEPPERRMFGLGIPAPQ